MHLSQATRTLGLFLLVMLITGSIDSIRNLPATALFGPSLVFFFIFSAIVFLIPAGLVSAELSSTWTEQGGIYDWVRMAFGDKIAVVAIWLQWINTMAWYPTILSTIAGFLAYLIDPALADNKAYLVTVILIVFWGLTLLNFRGIRSSARFASICGVLGMILPMVLIIFLGFLWTAQGHHSELHFTLESMLPSFGHTNSWISLTAIMTSFLGMELATVYVRNVVNPQRTFPRALLISVCLILFTMMFGSLAIATVLPTSNIHLVAGVIEAFEAFFSEYHILWCMPILAVLLLVGSVGQMVNWMISPAQGLLRAAQHGYFPRFFAQENKHAVPARMLILQAVLVSLMCFAFLFMPSVNGSYWLLTALSTQLYMIMYLFMFLAALRLRYKFPFQPRAFKIPGGNIGMWIVAMLGVVGTIITLIVGFFPPDTIDVGGSVHYEVVFSLGIVMMIAPVFLLYLYKKFISQ
ncbi:MAG: APC family permease [Gammaproteobacteria bacterium]|nr:APC family permease [Gammaproteobacteria bacterium]MCD8542064.1 APC family permease [Gammaproteobacteria bacterium]